MLLLLLLAEGVSSKAALRLLFLLYHTSVLCNLLHENELDGSDIYILVDWGSECGLADTPKSGYPKKGIAPCKALIG